MSEATMPCIFGKEIFKDCPVQKTIFQPNVEKYKQSSDPMIQQAKMFGEAFSQANNMTFLQLAPFCNVCPYLHGFKQQEMKK